MRIVILVLLMLAGRPALAADLLAWDAAVPDGGWSRWYPRPALAPGFAVDRGANQPPALRLSGLGNPHVFGGWRRVIPVEAGRSYRLHAEAEARGVVDLRRAAICQVRWLGPSVAEDVAPEYVSERPGTTARSLAFDEVLSVPDGVTSAEVSLLLQWSPGAEVAFRALSLAPALLPPPRPVRIATVYWRPTERSTPAENVASFGALVDQAAAARPDVVLLSEAITSIGTGLSVPEAAQEPQGPAFQALSEKARRHRAYIIYGAYEKARDVVYNSAFVINRDGGLAGAYRKVQVPVGEVEAGLSAGAAFAPIDLDFGRVGLLICHDTAFDEPSRILALAGAEVLFAPAWGGDLTQIRARAMDNGVWLVTAGYDVPSAVIDPTGEIRAQTWKGIGDGTAVHEVDLARKTRRPWVGDWRSAALKQRRTDAYRGLLDERPR
jgi:predicted amidohydrolase